MRTATKPLLALTAADLISGPLVAFPQTMSLRGAAHMLSQFSISGAPVINADGRCVGVISTTDFVSWAEKGENSPKRAGAHAGCAHSDWQIMDVDNFPTDEVGRYMTTDLVTVAPDTLVGDLARMMTDAHIHRVIVVDGQDWPVGVVSSTDVLAAVARAEERRAANTGVTAEGKDTKRSVFHSVCPVSAPHRDPAERSR